MIFYSNFQNHLCYFYFHSIRPDSSFANGFLPCNSLATLDNQFFALDKWEYLRS